MFFNRVIYEVKSHTRSRIYMCECESVVGCVVCALSYIELCKASVFVSPVLISKYKSVDKMTVYVPKQ